MKRSAALLMAGVLTLYTAAGCARPVAGPSPALTVSAAALQSASQATAPIGSHLEKFEQGPVEPPDADGDGISDLTYERAAYEQGGSLPDLSGAEHAGR